MRYPKKIVPCPIVEAIVEARYDSLIPSDAIFGAIYSLLDLAHDFGKIEQQPIMQLPEFVRNQDENLKYQPCYVLTKDNLQLQIGPHSIAFACINKYIGWQSFSNFVKSYFEKLIAANIFNKIERIGLRYVNLFQYPILQKINLKVALPSEEITDESLTMRIEKKDPPFIKIIQISNSVGIQSISYNGSGSLIDIDCVYPVPFVQPFDTNALFDNIETMHNKEKDMFYQLLSPEFLKNLNPVYEEEK